MSREITASFAEDSLNYLIIWTSTLSFLIICFISLDGVISFQSSFIIRYERDFNFCATLHQESGTAWTGVFAGSYS